MKNFKEIAEKCLKGELSGVFYISDGKSNFTACSKTLTPENNLVYRIITNSGHTLLINSFGYVGMSGLHVVNFIPDMKENDKRTIQVSLQEAKKWYRGNNDTLKALALSSFSKEELDLYPRSFDEYFKKYSNGSNILKMYPTKELEEKFNAYVKLISLRYDWIHIWSQEQGLEKDWEPDWTDKNWNWSIQVQDSITICTVGLQHVIRPLSFPTLKMADEFLDCFKDLLEQAKGLY